MLCGHGHGTQIEEALISDVKYVSDSPTGVEWGRALSPAPTGVLVQVPDPPALAGARPVGSAGQSAWGHVCL